MKLPKLKNTCKSGILLACAGLFLCFAQQSNAAVLFSFGSAGSWININTSTTLVWNFNWLGGTSYDFSSTDFQLRSESGVATTEVLTFSLFNTYGGAAGGGTNLISSYTGTSLTELDISGSNNVFNFGPVNLTNGEYSIQLSSSVSGAPRDSFQVKASALSLTNVPSNLYTTDGNTAGTSSIPETSSSIMAAVSVLGMLSYRRRNAAA